MHVLCPHCFTPLSIDSVGAAGELVCSSCGSTIPIERGSTIDWSAAKGRHTMGRFVLDGLLGSGGFGSVYRAHDPELDRFVALKVPRPSQLESAEQIDRFLREARSVAQLRHPGIVPIFEVGQAEAIPFLVSQLVPGVSLDDELSRRRLPPREAAELLAAVADALAYAHQQGIIHRDVKPSNILLGEDGAPFLTDFGLAKREVGEVTVTQDGQVLGTPAYMSPEQARGESHRVDGRSDVYSLGVVLYHMLTSELPFRGTQRMILHQVLNDEPRPPRRLNDRIPRDLETVCLQAMAKEPGRRYASASDLAADLRRFVTGQPVKARPVGRLGKAWRWCRRSPMLAAASATAVVALLAGTVVSVLFAFHQSRAAEREANDAQVLRAKEKQVADALERQKEIATDLRQQQDEKTRALTESEERGQKLRDEVTARHKLLNQSARMARRRGLDLCSGGQVQEGILWLTRALELLPAEDRDLGQTIRSDLAHWRTEAPVLRGILTPGQVVSFTGALATTQELVHREVLRLYDLRTNRPLGPSIWQDSSSASASLRSWNLSPDGKRLLLVRDTEVRVWDVDALERSPLVLPHSQTVKEVAWSPDSRRLVTVEMGSVQPASSSPRVNLPVGIVGNRLVPTRSGGAGRVELPRFATLRSAVRLWDLGSDRRPPLQAALECADQVNPHFTPDGKTLLLLSGSGNDLIDVAAGKRVGRLADEAGRPVRGSHPVFSPDGQTLVLWGWQGRLRLWDLASRRPRGGPLLLHPQANPNNASLIFRPDGKVLFCHWQNFQGRQQVQAWDVATGRPLSLPWPNDTDRPEKSFSPDGARLAAWNSSSDKITDVVLLDTVTGRRVGKPLAHGQAVQRLFFSPDSRRLLTVAADHKVRFWAARTGATEGTPVQLGDSSMGNEPIFGPRGQTIRSFPNGLQVWDVATGRPLPAPAAPYDYNVLLSGDERTLLVQKTERIPMQLLRDPHTLRPLRHDPTLRALALSPDGRLAVLVRQGEGKAATVILLRTDDLEPVGPPLPHPHGCSAATLSPDGKLVLTQAPGGTARLWVAATGLPRGDPIEDADGPIAFTPDSRSVWVACGRRIQALATATGRPVCQAKQHDDPVQKVLPGPDSQCVLTCSNSQVCLWHSQGRPVGGTLPRPYGAPDPVFSPDGKLVALSGRDILLRDTRTGEPVAKEISHDEQVQTIAFSPDGVHLLTQTVVSLGRGLQTTALHVWEVATGKLVHRTERSTPTAWAFSPSGNQVVLSTGAEVQLLDLSSARRPVQLLRHLRAVSSVSFSPDGSRILTVSTDSGRPPEKGWGEARLWNSGGGQVGDPLLHADRITAALFSPDSQVILTTSNDGTARLWDAQTGRCLGGPLLHNGGVFGGRFSPDGRSFATWAERGHLDFQEAKLWDRPPGSVTMRPASAESAVVSSDGAWQLKRRFNGRVISLWDALTGKPFGVPVRETRQVQNAWLSADGKRLLTAHVSGAQLWDTATGEAVGPRLGDFYLQEADLSPDARWIATVSPSGVQLWEAATGKPHGPPLSHPRGCRWLKFSPGGDLLMTSWMDSSRWAEQTFQLWDTATGKHRGEPWMLSSQSFPTFSLDGRFLVSTTRDLFVIVKDVKTGKEVAKFQGEQASLSPDGKVVAVSHSAIFRKPWQLWQVETSRKLGELPLGETVVEWSPDSKRLLTLSFGEFMRCWDAATVRPIGEPFRHAKPIRFGVFSADGQTVWTFNLGEARCWDAATGAARGDPLVFPAGVQRPYLSSDRRAVLLSLGDRFTAWDLQTRKPLYAPVKVDQVVLGQLFLGWLQFPSGRFVQAAHDDHTAELLDVAAGRPLARAFSLDWWAQPMDLFAPLQVPFGVSPDRSTFFTPADAQTLVLRDGATGEAFGSPLRHPSAVDRTEYAPDGRILLTHSGAEVRLWRVSTGKVLAAWQVSLGTWPHAFSPDGKLLLTGPVEPGREELCFWDPSTGKPAGKPLPHPGPIALLVFSADGKRLATAAGGAVRVWDAASRRLLWGPQEHGVELTGLTFSPDGRVLAALGGPVTRGNATYPGQKAWLWEAATGRPIGEPLTHAVNVTSVHFSPAGDIALVGNLNPYPRPLVIPAGDFQVWDTRSGAKKARLVHGKAVLALTFRPDGAYVATLDLDGVVRLWRATTWECIGETSPHKMTFRHGVSLLFGADGRSVIAADGSGARRVWQPPYPVEGTAAALRAEMEVRTGRTLDDEGVAHLLEPAAWEGRRGK